MCRLLLARIVYGMAEKIATLVLKGTVRLNMSRKEA